MLPTLIGVAASVLPDIVSWIAGDKAGGVAGKVADAVAAATGVVEPDAAARAIAANPEIAAQLRIRLAEIAAQAASEQHAERMALDAQRHAETLARIADVENARQRDLAFINAGRINWRANIMLGMTFLCVVAIVWVIAGYQIDGNSAVGGALLALLGTLAGCLKDAFGYEFGSSRGSSDKSDTITALAAKAVEK